MLADASSHPPPAKGRARLSSPLRRAAILEAAIDRFSRHGFRGTTTRELAMAAGITEPVLYQHFANKRDLYTAIVDHLIEETYSRFEHRLKDLPEDCTDRQFFVWLGEIILAWYKDTPQHVRLLLFSALEGHELAELWHQKATVEFIRWVEQFVRRRIGQGAFAHCDPTLVSRAFIYMVAHYGFSSLLFSCDELPRPSGEIVGRFVDIFLNGILSRKD